MANARQTWSLDEFHGGIDHRDGLFSANQTRMRLMENAWIDKGKHPNRRPPVLQAAGSFDAQTKGLVAIDGQRYTFAPKGSSIVNTGDVATDVQVLYFDVPDLCTGGWELIAAKIYNGGAAAWILHDYPSTAYPKVAMLHLWDGLIYAPTFVQDPYLPGSFSPSIADLADQEYDATFRPVLGQGASKAWTSTLRGNAHCCRTADGRIWNQRTKDAMLQDGEHWCFIVPEGLGTQHSFIVPRNADWMTPDQRWAYYVLEYDNNGTWTPMEEVTGTPGSTYQWSWSSVASRFAGGWNETRITVNWGRASAGLLRLSLVGGSTSLEVKTSPSVAAKASSGTAWKLSIGEAKWSHRGGDVQTTAAHDTIDLVAGNTYLLAVTADSVAFPELVDITSSFPNGWKREHYQFLRKIVTQTASNGYTLIKSSWKTYVAAAGTVDASSGSSALLGTGTTFLSTLKIGSTIRVSGVERVVATITDDLNLTITGTWPAPSVAVAWDVVYGYSTYASGKTHIYVDPTLAALLSVGNNLRVNGIDYQVSAVSGQDITITTGGIDGDFTGNTNQYWNPISKTNTPIITDYSYAFTAETDSSWYTDLVVEYVDLAGAEDALSIATATHDNTGGQITAIESLRQRMLISYPGSMQLWAIDQDTNRTAYLDTLGFGTGDQPTPPVVAWYGALALPIETGVRAISVVGANTDNLQDLNIGEPLANGTDLGVSCDAQFWPWRGQLILACNRGTEVAFLCLDYSRESKITAWSEWGNDHWSAAGLTSVDAGTVVVDGSSLWFRSGTKLYRFDATATTFRDWCDTAGDAYWSDLLFHFNDMGKPGQSKRFVALDVAQDGTSTISFQIPPYGSWGDDGSGPVLDGPTIEGITYGRSRYQLAMVGSAVALRIKSRDESGWRLLRAALDFILLRR